MMQISKKYNGIGLMSGTSCDGLDLAHCQFQWNEGHWEFELLETENIEYTASLKQKLREATLLSGIELTILDHKLGRMFGDWANAFNKSLASPASYIASHGHTIFHQPENGITLQIGNPNQINIATGTKVIADFRTADVLLGGQGAPLVPIGDRLLFPQYDACINLGGIANISFEENNERKAFDIVPANIPLNFLANRLDKDFDQNGEISRSGRLNITRTKKWYR